MASPYAFVTLVSSDSYLPGALALAAALKDVHPSPPVEPEVDFQTVCLVTPETVQVSTIKLLRKAFNLVIGVEVLEGESDRNLILLGRPDLNTVLTKLHIFRLTQFKKVIFLDADVLPIRPLSHLFNISHEFSAAPDVGWPDIFNSGVLVVSPGEDKFAQLSELLKSKGSWDGGDQGILNEWRGGDWNRLSFTYNTTPTAAYTYAPAYERYGSQISAIHFIGANKPWNSLPYRPPFSSQQSPDSNSTQAYDYQSLVDRWYSVYDVHYRSQTILPSSSFEVKRYESAWDRPAGERLSSPAPANVLSLEDLRRLAIEGLSGSGGPVESLSREGNYTSLPLEGRVDLMRPRRAQQEELQGKGQGEVSELEDTSSTPLASQQTIRDDPPSHFTYPSQGPSGQTPSNFSSVSFPFAPGTHEERKQGQHYSGYREETQKQQESQHHRLDSHREYHEVQQHPSERHNQGQNYHWQQEHQDHFPPQVNRHPHSHDDQRQDWRQYRESQGQNQHQRHENQGQGQEHYHHGEAHDDQGQYRHDNHETHDQGQHVYHERQNQGEHQRLETREDKGQHQRYEAQHQGQRQHYETHNQGQHQHHEAQEGQYRHHETQDKGQLHHRHETRDQGPHLHHHETRDQGERPHHETQDRGHENQDQGHENQDQGHENQDQGHYQHHEAHAQGQHHHHETHDQGQPHHPETPQQGQPKHHDNQGQSHNQHYENQSPQPPHPEESRGYDEHQGHQHQQSGHREEPRRPISPPLLAWNPAIEPPPTTAPAGSAFPTDTYFPNVWDRTPSRRHDHAYQGPSPPDSGGFFQPPPASEIPEPLRREGHYRNVTGEDNLGATPSPDKTKVKTVFPWEEKPRHMPGRVFPESDAPSPLLFLSPDSQTSTAEPSTPEPNPAPAPVRAHQVSPVYGLPSSLTYANAWDTVPSIQKYASKLVRSPVQHIPLAPAFDNDGWRKERKSWDERTEASSRDGDDEDNADDEDEPAPKSIKWDDSDQESSKSVPSRRRSRSGSMMSASSVKGKKKEYRTRSVQTMPREERNQGVQVDPPKERKSSMSGKRNNTSTGHSPLLPPVTHEISAGPDLPMSTAVPSPAIEAPLRPQALKPLTPPASTGLRSPLRSPRDFVAQTSPVISVSSKIYASPVAVKPHNSPPKPTSKGPSVVTRQISNDSSIGSPLSSVGPHSPSDFQPISSPMRKAGRVWDPARGVELFKRGSEEVLARFLKMGSWEDEVGR